MNSKQAFDEQQQIERGNIQNVDTDNRFGSSEAANDLRDMIDVCRRSDVVLHAIDIKGIRTTVDVTMTVFARKPTSEVALAPLTSAT